MKTHDLFKCVICDEIVGPYSRGITYHARSHGLTLQEFWLIQHGFDKTDIPKCQCSETCLEKTSWCDWLSGFKLYAKGHYDLTKRQENTIKALKVSHWSRGKSKKDDERLRRLGEKSSLTLKKQFQKNEIVHWSKTDIRDDVINKIKLNRSSLPSRQTHWKWSSEIDLLDRISESTTNNFHVVSISGDTLTKEYLEHRINNKEKILNVTCNRCNTTRCMSVYSVIRNKAFCHNCDTKFMSQFESDVFDYVTSLGVTAKKRKLGPWGELDIYVPEFNFAIECNGLYWHSDAIQDDKNYHEKKRIRCLEHGISLFHLFEDEWREKQHIVKNILAHKFHLNKTIGARKLHVKETTLIERKVFFNSNHIDGNVPAISSFGLVGPDEKLFAMASFRLPFKKTRCDKEYELARFATATGYVVPGALGRLIKAFLTSTNCKKIISYQDTRFGGDGKHYIKSGFEHIADGTPRFWWTDTTSRFDRLTTRATDVPESINAIRQRRFKIWGTTNILWQNMTS